MSPRKLQLGTAMDAQRPKADYLTETEEARDVKECGYMQALYRDACISIEIWEALWISHLTYSRL